MEVPIREADTADVERLVLLHGRFMEHHVAADPRFALRAGAEARWPERIASAVEDPEVLVLVAVAGPDLVGCAFTLIRDGALDSGPRKIGYLCDVFVEPDHRRHGIARRFLDASRDWLRSRGIRRLEASWAVRSEEACRTWPALGFEAVSVSGTLDL